MANEDPAAVSAAPASHVSAAPASGVSAAPASHVSAAPASGAEVDRVLQRARLLVYKHPVAAQALFKSFVSEGRRFAQTPEGARLQAQLARSALVQRARAVWEVGTMNVLSADSDALIPSAVVEAIGAAARHAALEPRLAATFEDVDIFERVDE